MFLQLFDFEFDEEIEFFHPTHFKFTFHNTCKVLAHFIINRLQNDIIYVDLYQ